MAELKNSIEDFNNRLDHVKMTNLKTDHLKLAICVLLSPVWLYTTPYSLGYSPPNSSVHGILQAWILEWAAILLAI